MLPESAGTKLLRYNRTGLSMIFLWILLIFQKKAEKKQYETMTSMCIYVYSTLTRACVQVCVYSVRNFVHRQ